MAGDKAEQQHSDVDLDRPSMTPEQTEDVIKGETEEGSSHSRSAFKTRLRSYAYSAGDVALRPTNGVTAEATLPITPSPRKRRAVSISASTSTASKRRAITTSVSVSADSSTPMLTLSDSSKRSSGARKALRSTDPHSPVNNLVDSIQPHLMLLLVGLNPGLKTAETGHAYAHPSNLFWKLLHSSGLTARRHLPSETHDLKGLYGIGNTNICVRPTRDGAGLSKDEMEAGVPILDEKIRAFRPEVVCIVGKGVWDTIFKVKTGKKQTKGDFNYGWQDEKLWLGREVDEGGSLIWEGARTFVTTTTSGLAAGMKPPEKEAVWKVLGDWIVARRETAVTKVEVKDEVL